MTLDIRDILIVQERTEKMHDGCSVRTHFIARSKETIAPNARDFK